MAAFDFRLIATMVVAVEAKIKMKEVEDFNIAARSIDLTMGLVATNVKMEAAAEDIRIKEDNIAASLSFVMVAVGSLFANLK